MVAMGLTRHDDGRGSLTELVRQDWLGDVRAELPRMAYVSWTNPGESRGPHEHREQWDYFAFPGPGQFLFRLADNRKDSPSYGCDESYSVGAGNRMLWLVPPGVIHGYRCVGGVPAMCVNFATRLYRGWGSRQAEDCVKHEDNGLDMSSLNWTGVPVG